MRLISKSIKIDFLVLLMLSTVLYDCNGEKQNKHRVLIKSDNFEGIIFFKNYMVNLPVINQAKSVIDFIPYDSVSGWNPSNDDIYNFEDTLNDYWIINQGDLPNKNSENNLPIRDLTKFKRQYVGFIDSTETKYIWVNLVNGDLDEIKWTEIPIVFDDPDQYKRSIIYSVDNNTIVEILNY